jgi:hypothetical protein
VVTIALRFADNFAPSEGTIKAHENLLEKNGFVWYGKLGTQVSDKIIKEILNSNDPKVLLIHSGKPERYWVHVDKIQHDIPERNFIPKYYRDNAGMFKTWIRIRSIKSAEAKVLRQCRVRSSGRLLSEVSRSSMSPYFIIETDE